MAIDLQAVQTMQAPAPDSLGASGRGVGADKPRGSEASGVTAQTANDGMGPLSLSLAAAQATISAGQNLVAQYVMSGHGTVASIRIVDPSTGQVIAQSPPDSIAQIQEEIAAFQKIGAAPRPDSAN